MRAPVLTVRARMGTMCIRPLGTGIVVPCASYYGCRRLGICSNHCALLTRVACLSSQVLFSDGKFQWKRLENLISLAREGGGGKSGAGLDLSDTVKDALRIVLLDDKLRTQVGGTRFKSRVGE